jgi:hypothetical protein
MHHHTQHKSVMKGAKKKHSEMIIICSMKPNEMASNIYHLRAYFQSETKPLLCFALLPADQPLRPLFIFTFAHIYKIKLEMGILFIELSIFENDSWNYKMLIKFVSILIYHQMHLGHY